MKTSNKIYLGKSIDGYIAGRNNDLAFLEIVPNPEGSDLGFAEFMNGIDALLMGRNTFEILLSFDVPWPYDKPVYVLSNQLKSIAEHLNDKAFLIQGSDLKDVLRQLHDRGHSHIYVDGGKLIQSFLKEDLIDEMILATLPIILGGGSSLFGEFPKALEFEHIKTDVLLGQIVKSYYSRKRN